MAVMEPEPTAAKAATHDDLDLTAKQLAAEVKALEQLTDDIDQAASLAMDCRTLCPEAKTLLGMAWWFTEDAIREYTGHCSVKCGGPGRGVCAVCRLYNELRIKAQWMRSRGI